MSTDGSRSGQPALCERRAMPRMDAGAAMPPGEAADLARTLHDGLAQTLAFALIQLDAAQGARADARDAAIRHSRQLIHEALRATRGMIGSLREADEPPPALHRQILQVAEDVGRISRRNIDIDCPPVRALPPVPVRLLIEHAVRELLVNACKHAPRARVWLRLRESGTWPAGLVLTVIDDGPGFDPAVLRQTVPGNHGLRLLPASLAAIGARLSLRTCPGAGVHARVSWQAPFPQDSTVGMAGLQ